MMGGGGGGGDMNQIKKMLWRQFEDELTDWLARLKSSINGKKMTKWESGEEAIEGAKKVEEAGHRENAVEDAFEGLQDRFVELAIRYVEVQQQPQVGSDKLKNAFENLVREVHNPATREALLLMVEDEFRDDVRDRLDEIGSLVWGIFDLTDDRMTDDAWFVLSLLGAWEGKSVEEYVEEADHISQDDIPEWVENEEQMPPEDGQ